MTTITAHSTHNLQVEIQARGHTLLADEPIIAGGDDMGPSPYDLLLSSLAACKVMTVHLYARRKQWDVQRVTVKLTHQKIYAKDCADCVTEGSAKVDEIISEIHFEGDLTEEQIDRLGEISDRCPVHRTLTTETVIRTTVV